MRLTSAWWPKAAASAGSETVTFNDAGAGDLPIDFRDGNLLTASLNGTAIATSLVNGHLILPAGALRKGPNTLATTFTANIAASGKAITRYLDKDDGNEYLYTLFVPMDADMAFPCFDQPDLKATFKLRVVAPEKWTVIANSASLEATEPPYAAPPDHTWIFSENQTDLHLSLRLRRRAVRQNPGQVSRRTGPLRPPVPARQGPAGSSRSPADRPAGNCLAQRLLCPAFPVPQVRSRPDPRLSVRRHGARGRDISERRRCAVQVHSNSVRLL